MGIVSLNKVLKQYCSDQLVTYSLSELPGLIVAVDVSVFLYKYIRTAGEKGWIDLFIMLLRCFKRYRIKAVCIFDGPNPPKEKKTEQECRRGESEKLKTKLKCAKDLLEKVSTLIDERRTDEYDDEMQSQVKLILSAKGRKVDAVMYHDIFDVRESLRIAISKWSLQTIAITTDHKQKAKDIIDCLGIAQIQADGEAETLCAILCVKGMIDAVLTEDTDVLAYGTPLTFFQLDLRSESVTGVYMPLMLEDLEMTLEEFRDMCILLTCDYNKHNKKMQGLRGFPPGAKNRKRAVGIGWKGAYAMIKEYRRLEQVENYLLDSSPLDYRVCRQLFSVPDEILLRGEKVVIPLNKPIDQDRLEKFLKDHNCKVSMKYILDVWKPLLL